MWTAVGRRLFRYRSFLPLPWLLILFLDIDFKPHLYFFGLMVSTCGALLRIWAVSWIGSFSRTRSDKHGALCERGPYRLSRNPLYIANILMYVGLCISGGNFFLSILVGLYTLLYYVLIVHFEESTWNETKEYKAYSLRVSRWLPNGDFRQSMEIGPIYPALRSERSSLLALIGLLSLILVFGLKLF